MYRIRVHLLLFIYLFYLIFCADCKNPRRMLCANSDCSEPISKAQAKLLYLPSEESVLRFKKGAQVLILGKNKEKDGYWLGKIGNNVGFVPSSHLQETAVFKNSEMLKHEVPLSIENNKITVIVNENNNLGQEIIGTSTLPDTNSDTLDVMLNDSDGVPPQNLIHKDSSTIPGKSVQEEVNNGIQAPEAAEVKVPNEKPAGNNASIDQTLSPLNVINQHFSDANQNNEQEPKEKLNFVEGSGEDLIKYVNSSGDNVVGNNSEDLSKSLVSDQLKSGNSDEITNSDSNSGSKVNSNEEQMDTAETARVDYGTSDEKLSKVQNVNEKLGENLRGNVVGSMDIYNSSEDLNEISTNSSTLTDRNDNISISSTSGSNTSSSNTSSSNTSSSNTSSSNTSSSSSSTNDGDSFTKSDNNSQKSSSDGISNNLQNPDLTNKNSLKEKNLQYTLTSEIYETTALPVEGEYEFNVSEHENENFNLSQNTLPSGNTPGEGNVVKQNIPPYPGQNPNQFSLENRINLNERTADTVNANRNMPESSSIDGISTNEVSSSISNSISASAGTSSIGISSTSSSAPAFNTDTNDGKAAEDNPKFSEVTADQLPKENTATYQNPEQVRMETIISGSMDGINAWASQFGHTPAIETIKESTHSFSVNKEIVTPQASETIISGSMDGINAWASQFGHTPAIETIKESTHSFSVNKEIVTPQASEGQPGIVNAETASTQHSVLSETVDIPTPTTTISSQEDTTEIFRDGVPAEGTTEKLNYELPAQTSPLDSVIQNTEGIISEDVVTEPSVPVPDHVDNTVEESTLENNFPEVSAEGGDFFSKISNFLSSWIGAGDTTTDNESETKRDEVVNEDVMKDLATEKLSQESTATLEGTCKSINGLDGNCEDTPLEESKTGFWNIWIESKNLDISSSQKTLMYLVVTAVTVLLFTLGYYFIEKFQSDGPLIAKVNKLEQELLVSSKECVILKDELANTKEKLNLFETSSNDKIITALQLELEESKKMRSVLENNIEVLQQELDAATEAGLDLNRMLSEVLTQSGGSETLMKSVEHLQSQLNNQQKIIDEMTTKLVDKTKENQELQDEISAASEKIFGLESEIEDMRGNLNVHLKDNEDMIRDLTSKNNEMKTKISKLNEAKEKEVSELKNAVAELKNKVKSVSDSLKIKVEEYNNLKESIKKIKAKDKNIDSLFDVSRIKAELEHSTSENTSLKERLKVEEDEVVKLGDKVKILDEEIQKLKMKSAEAEKEKTEAQTRLEVLSNYFKEKETQLQKELGLKEAMWVQKQGDDSTIYERIKSLEEEINNYKSLNDTLKKEILDQERSLKAQITTLERKAHDNWIAARQAERKLEESKQEGAQLRNKLTLLETNMSNDLETSPHHRTGEEVNGGDSLSPLIHETSSPLLFPPPLPLDPNNTALMPPGFIPPPMFMPPPPGGFMPPPPPFLPGDHRPPPLGRMSSPPLNNRFSPPPPEFAYDRISTPPMSPSTRNYRSPNESDRERFRHRTPTSPSFRSRNWQESPTAGMSGFRPIASERDTRREHKGGSNLSSSHSSDSLDKSSRHSSRV